MKFFWVPQGKFYEVRVEITRRGQKNKSQKIFFAKKEKHLSRLAFFVTFLGNEKKVREIQGLILLYIIIYSLMLV